MSNAAPARARAILRAAALCVATFAAYRASAEPPVAPILRIETTMHSALARRIVVDPHGRLISAGDDKTIRIWQLPQGRLTRVLRWPIGPGYEGRIYALALSPDGRYIAAGGWTGWDWDRQGSVYLFDTGSGELVRRIAGFPDAIGSLAYSKDGRHLAVGLHADGGLRILRTSDYAVVAGDAEYRDKILGTDFRDDGVLAVAALDGQLRLYDRQFRLLVRKRTAPGTKPLTVRFSPDGRQLAVSFHDVPAVAVLSAPDLSLAFAPDTTRLAHHTRLTEVAWSADGSVLYGCGDYSGPGATPILRWGDGGRGAMEALPATRRRIADLQPLPGGGVAFAAEDPALGLLDATGRTVLLQGPELADFPASDPAFGVSADGARVQFALAPGGGRLVRFALFARELLPGASPAPDMSGGLTQSPRLALADWQDSARLRLNGVTLPLDDYEIARAYAIAPDHATLVLGTEWALRAYDHDARLLWKAGTPGVVRSVAVAAGGRTVVATLSDGTVRWYRIEDGVEFLALFPHATGEEWIAWTPEGYYVSSNAGDNFVGWHLNRGKERTADFYRAVQFERILYRPDLVDQAFRGRGRPVAPAPRRAIARFDVAQLAAIAPPRVQVELMGVPERAADGRARARLRISADRAALPLTDQAVFVNDIPVIPAASRAIAAAERDVLAREMTVNLAPGLNRVRVEVATAASLGFAELELDAGPASGAPPLGDLYLLAVGINEFPGLKDANLSFAARDAEEFAGLLRAQEGRAFRRVLARTLTDRGGAGPDRATIVAALDFAAAAGENDTVIVFLASHGVSAPNGDYFFVPRDARAADIAAAVHGGAADSPSLIRWSVLFDALGRVAGRRVLVVDTCHARNVVGRADLRSLGKRSASSRFSLVLAAKGDEESQEYAPARHGLFTFGLLEALRGAGDTDGDGAVTLAEAFGFAVPIVDRLRDRAIGPQTPQLLAPPLLGETVLARSRGHNLTAPSGGR